MRQNGPQKRGRGRSNNNARRSFTNSANRNYESNGPDVKVRGNAGHVAEKYAALARDAIVSGDRIAAENFLQHAEHYNRLGAAAAAQVAERQQAQEQERRERAERTERNQPRDQARERSQGDQSQGNETRDGSGGSDATEASSPAVNAPIEVLAEVPVEAPVEAPVQADVTEVAEDQDTEAQAAPPEAKPKEATAKKPRRSRRRAPVAVASIEEPVAVVESAGEVKIDTDTPQKLAS